MNGYDESLVRWMKEHRYVTPNGVAYDRMIVEMGPPVVCLVREPHHTDADIQAAADYVRQQLGPGARVEVENMEVTRE